MSEQTEQPTQLVNNELTDRLNKAYIGGGYTLLKKGTDNIVMISGEKNGEEACILLTLEGICEVAEQLKKEANEKGSEISKDNTQSNE
jgi:hypothetical protein